MSTGLNRDTSDAFYTTRETALECIKLLKTVVKISDFNYVVEPGCGQGSFSDYFYERKDPLIALDMNPQKDYMIEADFFDYEFKDVTNALSIGNPPFGRQSSLVKRFIKRCCEFSNVIAFILPNSFKKESLQKTFPLDFHLILQHNIPENSFIINGESHNVPCVFQVWKRMNKRRKEDIKHIPNGYTFVKKDEDPHFSIRRVGVKAGAISRDIEDKSEQSHYFIILDDVSNMDEFEEMFKQLEFPDDNVVGPRSISKNELVYLTNNTMI